jgi:hypothetical protein
MIILICLLNLGLFNNAVSTLGYAATEVRVIIDDEVERMWKEKFVAYFKALLNSFDFNPVTFQNRQNMTMG